MNTYSTNSPNPYAKRYLTKGRRSLDNHNAYLDVWQNKKIKKEAKHIEPTQNQKSETYNFLTDDNNYIQNDFHELYDNSLEFDRLQEAASEHCVYLHENDNHHVIDENSVFIDGNDEEYSIDFIDETDNTTIDSFNYNLYQPDQHLYNNNNNNCFLETQFVSQPIKSKRKQGIVGRPTLSSPQRLLVPDNVYSRGNAVPTADNESNSFFADTNNSCNNYRNRQTAVISLTKNCLSYPIMRKSSSKHTDSIDHDDNLQRNGSRNRPRILSKPILPEYRQLAVNSHIYFNASEQDALEIAQRTVANREFARNLVKRAERQGTVIDKNKIPLSVFEQQPVEVLMKSALDEQLGGIAEIKETEQLTTQPQFTTTTINVTDVRKSAAPIVVKKESVLVAATAATVPKPPQMTASDILKQKWKAANRQQS